MRGRISETEYSEIFGGEFRTACESSDQSTVFSGRDSLHYICESASTGLVIMNKMNSSGIMSVDYPSIRLHFEFMMSVHVTVRNTGVSKRTIEL